MSTVKLRRGSALGLLAVFGAAMSGSLPAFSIGTSRRKDRDPRVVADLQARADAKRKRRAENPFASEYAKSNWPR